MDMIKEDDVRDDVPGRKLGIAKSKDEQIKKMKVRRLPPCLTLQSEITNMIMYLITDPPSFV